MDDDRELLRALLRDDAGRPLEWPWPDVAPPHPAARRLLDALGVVGVPAVSAVAVARCESSGCARPARAGMRFCRAHQPVSELRAGRIGLDALARMDAGQPQKPDMTPDISAARNAAASMVEPETEAGVVATRKPKPGMAGAPAANLKWTPDVIIEAIQAKARELGRQPVRDELPGGLTFACIRVFGGWAAAVEASGFERPTRATKLKGRGAVLVEREPEAGEQRVAASPPDAEREAPASAAAGKGPVSPPDVLSVEAASRSTSTDTEQLAQLHADRGKIDAHLATLDETSIDVAKQEVVDGEIIPVGSFAAAAAELEAAYLAAHDANERLSAAGAAFRAHLPLIVAIEQEWGVPLTTEEL